MSRGEKWKEKGGVCDKGYRKGREVTKEKGMKREMEGRDAWEGKDKNGGVEKRSREGRKVKGSGLEEE